MVRLREDFAMTEDCKRFESSLLELAYGEIDEPLADELRMHAAGCQGCSRALDEIMLTRKLASASEFAASDAGWARTKAEPFQAVERPAGFAERLKRFLLAPALATAAVAAMVFVITFFLYERSPKRDNILREEPKSLSNVETETTVKPAEDKKAEEGYLKTEIAEQSPGEEEASSKSSTDRSRSAAANLGTAGPKPVEKAGDEPQPFPAAAEQARESRKKSSASPDFDELNDLLSGSAAGGAAAPQASKPLAGLVEAEESKKSKSAPADITGDFENGMAAYSRGDCDAATTSLLKVVDQRPSSLETAYAMHHIARCEKRRGRFAAALPWYEKLLGRFPNYSDRAEALLEAAACHRRLGQIDWARKRLDELSRIPGWEERAKEEIERLSE
jgi:TolA-binding protein